MSNPNTSEKSNELDRQENQTKGNVSTKKVALYTYESGTDELIPINADNPLPTSGGAAGGGLTDAELRASPVEITGTIDVAPPEGGATEDQQVAQTEVLEEIEHAIQSIASARGIAGDLRVTRLGGTTAVTGTLTGVTTVATVTTVAGLTNIGGLPAVTLIPSNQNTTAVLSNINNVV